VDFDHIAQSMAVEGITNYTQKSPWKCNIRSASQESLHPLCNPKVHCCVRKSPPMYHWIKWLRLIRSHGPLKVDSPS